MAGGIRVDINTTGIEKAIARIKGYQLAKRQGVADIVAETAINIQRDAKKNARVKTGRMRSSIRFKLLRGGLAAVVGTDVFYAKFVELGTRRMQARPFLYPALAKHRPKYMADLERELRSID